MLSEAIANVPSLKREEVASYRRTEDQLLHATGWLLAVAAAESLARKNAFISELKLDANNKPGSDSFYMNISQSGNLAACVFSERCPVAVDVEKVREINLAHFTKVLTEDEMDDVTNDADSMSRFFELWTQKESVMKADGRGFRIDPKSIQVSPDNTATLEGKKWFLHSVSLRNDYKAHICSAEPNLALSVHSFETLSGILERL